MSKRLALLPRRARSVPALRGKVGAITFRTSRRGARQVWSIGLVGVSASIDEGQPYATLQRPMKRS